MLETQEDCAGGGGGESPRAFRTVSLRTVWPGADPGLTGLLEAGEEIRRFVKDFRGPRNGEEGGGGPPNQL